METKKQVVLNNVHLKIQLQRLKAKEEDLKAKVDEALRENSKLREQVIDDEQRVYAHIERDIEFFAAEICKMESSRPFAIKEELEGRIRGLEKMIEERKKMRKTNLLVWAGYVLAFLTGVGAVWIL